MEGKRDVVLHLKESTRTRHEAVEEAMPEFGPNFTIENYVRVLQAFLGFFEPVEEGLVSSGCGEVVGLDLPTRLRSALLRRDLAHFGSDKATIDTLPRCTELFPIDSHDKALGVLYVLEGSTLGGQILAKQLQARFGLETSLGLAFFANEGREVGRQWRDLCDVLRKTLVSEEATDRATNGAMLTFDSLNKWLKRNHL